MHQRDTIGNGEGLAHRRHSSNSRGGLQESRLRFFHELDPIAERIAKLESSIIRNLYTVNDRDLLHLESSAPAVKMLDQICDMSFRSFSHGIIFRTDMYLPIADFQP